MNAYIIAKLSIPYFYKVFLDFKIDFLIKIIKKYEVSGWSFYNFYVRRTACLWIATNLRYNLGLFGLAKHYIHF